MVVAVKKIDIQPVIKEIHYYPFWVVVFIVLFFVVGNLFEILWMMLRDLRRFVFRIFKWPKMKLRKYGTNMRHRLKKRYGDKARGNKKYTKK
jgi:hypothetical protein